MALDWMIMSKPHLRLPNLDCYDIIRFNKYIYKKSENDCWIWLGGRTGNIKEHMRTPIFKIGNINYVASRIMFFLVHEIDPGEYQICHSCDNRICVNPKHLWIGTQSDNTQDASNKGRLSTTNHCYFDSATVKKIREDHKNGSVSKEELAKKYGVGEACIHRMVINQTYRHVK